MDTTDLEKRKEECEQYHYAQSSKVSTLARNIIYGIVGTIWVIVYSSSENLVELPCMVLRVCLVTCFLYLLLDLVHYFCDAYSYRKESFQLETVDYLDQHEKYMDKISRRSFIILCIKFGGTIFIAFLFIVGFLRQFAIL